MSKDLCAQAWIYSSQSELGCGQNEKLSRIGFRVQGAPCESHTVVLDSQKHRVCWNHRCSWVQSQVCFLQMLCTSNNTLLNVNTDLMHQYLNMFNSTPISRRPVFWAGTGSPSRSLLHLVLANGHWQDGPFRDHFERGRQSIRLWIFSSFPLALARAVSNLLGHGGLQVEVASKAPLFRRNDVASATH